jgi:Zinc knuckle
VHPSFDQSTSSSCALTLSRGRTATREEGKGKTKTKSKSRSKSRDSKNIKCWKCGKSGHICKDCRSKATGELSAYVAVTEDSGYALCTFAHVGN